MITELQHARVRLALHRLHTEVGTPLLLLHELAGSAADFRICELTWAGPVYALDLSGHGHSGHLRGGAYAPERWTADADAALRELGDDAWIAGVGVSAYVALLLAGARPQNVRGAVLLPGRGLDGGGPEPDFTYLPPPLPASGRTGALQHEPTTDPAVYFSNEIIRPVARARACADSAGPLILCEDGSARPPWWQALYGAAHVHVHQTTTLATALSALLGQARPSSAPHAKRPRRSA